jgi:hypothetical protein
VRRVRESHRRSRPQNPHSSPAAMDLQPILDRDPPQLPIVRGNPFPRQENA